MPKPKPKPETIKSSDTQICVLRVCFVTTLIAAAGVCGVVAYSMTRRLEHEMALSTFDNIADSALLRAQQLVSIKIEGASLLAELYSSSFPDPDQWPFVSLPGFTAAASRIGLMARPTDGAMDRIQSFAMNMLINPDQVESFEQHAKQVFEEQGYPEGTGYNEGVGFGIFHFDRNKTRCRSGTGTGEADSDEYQSSQNISAPLFQGNTENLMSIMLLDLHHTHDVGPWIDSLLDCAQELNEQSSCNQQWHSCSYGLIPCSYTTSSHKLLFNDGEPLVNIGVPIFPSGGKHQVTGIVTTVIAWSEALNTCIPSYLKGIRAVISPSDGGEPYTYEINNGVATLLGRGDHHDPALGKYAHSIILNGIFSISRAAPLSVEYTLTLTPTQETFEDFYTFIPVMVCVGFVAIIGICTLVFSGYDYLVRDQARRRTAILDLKRRFVRFVSHEIRTPLNTSCMGLDLLNADLQEFSKAISKPHPPEQSSKDADYDTTKIKVSEWLDIMGDVMDNCRNSVSVLNDILSYDKIEAGTLHLEMDPVNIWEIARKTVGEFQIQAKTNDITLILNEENGLIDDPSVLCAPCAGAAGQLLEERYCVLGDSIRLAQVLRNLISNALKFSPAHHRVVASIVYKPQQQECNSLEDRRHKHHFLKAATAHSDFGSISSLAKSSRTQDESECEPLPRCGSIEISVCDEGVGMDEYQLQLLFGEGVQFDANRLQHGGGSGLGLFISRNIILQHGGSIEADSDGPGLGSTFKVELPLYYRRPMIVTAVAAKSPRLCKETTVKTSGQAMTTTTPVVARDSECSSGRHRRILVVEDVVSNSKMLCRLLERAGHECTTAMNGQEAVDMIKEDMEMSAVVDGALKQQHDIERQSFDTILIDNEMPIMDGPNATRIIRSLGFRGVIFGCTGNVLQEDIASFKDHGADDVVAKPIRYSKIEECWAKHHSATS